MRLVYSVGALVVVMMAFTTSKVRAEDEAEGEDGIEFEDNTVYRAVVESCAGWRLNKLPEVKNFIHGDLVSKFERTEFKKIPGKAPIIIFYNQAGKEMESLNIEKYSREDLNKMLVSKGIPRKSGHDEV